MICIFKLEYVCWCKVLMVQMEFNSIVILLVVLMYICNCDVEYVYCQDSDFQYFIGFLELEVVMVLIFGCVYGEYVLFCCEWDLECELWDGLCVGQDGVIGYYGVDDVFFIGDIDDILFGLIEGCDWVYYVFGVNFDFDCWLMDWINVICFKVCQGVQLLNEFVVFDYLLYDQWLYKSVNEVKVMCYVVEVFVWVYIWVMEVCWLGLFEYYLEVELEYEFCKGGVKMLVYGLIVVVGCNVCILYYCENDVVIKDGDLILIDVGCEIDCYVSDIICIFFVNGCFSFEQKVIYELVLEVNMVVFDYIVFGCYWNEVYEVIVWVIIVGLVCLGLLEGDVDELIVYEVYKVFYMYCVGYWLGMDVYDVGEYCVGGEWWVFELGMVMIVELGIYIVLDNIMVVKKWCGIGVCIEDDVVVICNGCEVLINGVLKIVVEIEVLMVVVKSEVV